MITKKIPQHLRFSLQGHLDRTGMDRKLLASGRLFTFSARTRGNRRDWEIWAGEVAWVYGCGLIAANEAAKYNKKKNLGGI